MKTTDTFRLLLLTAVMLLTSLTVQAQDGVIRRNTTTTTTRTTKRTTTTTRSQQDRVVRPHKTTTGTLSITSSPTDAAVKIDGEYMGTTPLTLRNRKAGKYTVTVSYEGYDSQTRTATVTAGKTATCSVSLKKKQIQQQATIQQPAQRQSATTSSSASSQTFTVGGVTFKMIRVEGLGSPFYIGETEVTQELWQAVMGNNPSNFKGYNLPVEYVSWNDCKEFLSILNILTGKNFRLPKEKEWEYAAKGGNKSHGYEYSSSNTVDDVAWYWKNSGDHYLSGTDVDWNWDKIKNNNGRTHPVKTKKPNELGIYDMSGNVWEWCEDFYDSSGSYRVFRGGSWYDGAWYCRVSCRGNSAPSNRVNNLGLRLAL